MKKLALLVIFVLSALAGFSQAPQGLNYQGVARNAGGTVFNNVPVTVTFVIHDGSAGGNTVFQEMQTKTTNQYGLFNMTIGSVNTADFALIPWASGLKFLEVDITVNGTQLPSVTTQMLSVPYALVANSITPNTVIIEEIKPMSVSPVPLTPITDNSWHQRNFTGQTVPTNSFVTLNGANIKFLKTGMYLISASAPAYKTGRHKLCFRETPSGSGTIKITGTSEYSDAVPVSGSVYGITTRSVVLGILMVDNLNVQYVLDHYIEQNSGGVDALGVRSNIPNISEVFAQIMIQKIQ